MVTGSDQEELSKATVLIFSGNRVKRNNSPGSKELFVLSESTKNAAKLGVLVKTWCFFHLNSFKYTHYFLFIEIRSISWRIRSDARLLGVTASDGKLLLLLLSAFTLETYTTHPAFLFPYSPLLFISLLYFLVYSSHCFILFSSDWFTMDYSLP